MGRKLVLGFLAMMAVLIVSNIVLAPGASALEADQKVVMLTMEQGSEVEFHLYMSGGGTEDITHSGEINSWVSHTSSISSGEWLKIRVSVPNDAYIGSYNENIKADGTVITRLTVIVVAPFSESLILIQDKVDDMRGDQNDLESNVKEMIEHVTIVEGAIADLQSAVSEVDSRQKEISDVESSFDAEIQLLQERIAELESENAGLEDENRELDELTGMMTVNWSSAGFVLGVIITIVVVMLLFKGAPNLRRISSGLSSGLGRLVPKRRASQPSGSSQPAEEEMRIGEPGEVEEPMESQTRSRPSQVRVRGRGEFSYKFRPR